MKRILLVISIILIQKVLFAQNWAPLISVDKYNFRLDASNFVSSTIWVDSIQLSGVDSIFFLNRTGMCENCWTVIGGCGGGPPICNSCYGLKNQPEFLQSKCIVHQNGVFQFLGSSNLVLNSLSSIGNSWIFDSTLNIQANIISVGFDSVFGNLDSIKTILLTSGDSIILSKNFGLLQYPNGYSQNSYYRLIGIEGRNVGEIVPKFSDFYNFNIGDMFEYLDVSTYSGIVKTIRKYEIISKQVSGDSIIFGLNGLQKMTFSVAGGGGSGVQYSLINSMIVIDSTNHIANSSYNNQMRPVYADLPNKFYGHVKFSMNSYNLLEKSIGHPNQTQLLFYPCSYQSDTMRPNQMYDAVYRKFVIGLGQTDLEDNYPLYGTYGSHLTAYRKGLDTVGVFTPDSVLTIPNKIEVTGNNNFISIYPNPASTSITIYVNQFMNENSRITISDMENRIVLSDDFSNSMLKTLDVSSFANGVYMLKIFTGDDTFVKKLVVQR